MARRLAIIGLFMVLAHMATGCHLCGHFKAKKQLRQQYRGQHHVPAYGHGYGYGYADPCSCSSSSAAGIEAPILPNGGESLPLPKKMPATTMNNTKPVLTSFDK